VSPTITLTSPANNSSSNAPATITIAATAADADGTVSKVDFYNGSTLIGTDATAPYSYTWTGVAAGNYTISARVTDNLGATTISNAASITVIALVNQAPTVTLTSPANNSSANAPATIAIAATAADADGTVSKVDFYNGSTLIGTDATAPYSYNWTNVAAGSYAITAKATDNSGASTTSSVATVTINAVTNTCSTIAQYVENGNYVAGSKVKNAGRQFECKEFPYSGWCNGAAWAYGPGTGAYWTDAWYDRGSCGARAGEEASVEENTEVTIAPNPATDFISILLNTASTISIYNNQGTVVLPSTNLEAMGRLNISSLAVGMYFVKIDTGSAVITKMILKR
jgi:hypothetical protein